LNLEILASKEFWLVYQSALRAVRFQFQAAPLEAIASSECSGNLPGGIPIHPKNSQLRWEFDWFISGSVKGEEITPVFSTSSLFVWLNRYRPYGLPL
jgi:hypothetical protein